MSGVNYLVTAIWDYILQEQQSRLGWLGLWTISLSRTAIEPMLKEINIVLFKLLSDRRERGVRNSFAAQPV